MIELLAPAKINPFLSVGGLRDDGRHEIVSVMQAISLADRITIADAAELRVTCSPRIDGPNLAERAASVFATVRGRQPMASIANDKRIPVAGGLAGGSTDAAAVLVGLKALWDERVSRKALEKIGATLGSDVAFCVRGGTCVARGAGDDLAVLACPEPVWWVVCASEARLATPDVYAKFDRLGGAVLGDPWEVADALARSDVERLGSALRNDLEPAALSLMPSLARGREALEAADAAGVIISGSGPTWLGLARDEADAQRIATSVAEGFERVEVASSVPHGARIVDATGRS